MMVARMWDRMKDLLEERFYCSIRCCDLELLHFTLTLA